MSKSVEVQSGGIGFFGLLAIVFITLKLCGVTEVAEWSWFWVLSPVWIPIILAGFVVAAIVVFAAWMESR